MQSCRRLCAPLTYVPSRILLWTLRRLPTGPPDALFFFGGGASFASSFAHGLQSRPLPLGPALVYGVTVNRLPQISQFANCPAFGAVARSISSTSSSSSSESCKRFFCFWNFFEALILSIAFCSSFLRFSAEAARGGSLVAASEAGVEGSSAFWPLS